MSKRKIAMRMMGLGLRIGKYAKTEIEKEAKYIVKQKLADKKTARQYANKMMTEAKRMKAKLEAYARAEMKKAQKSMNAQTTKKKKVKNKKVKKKKKKK